MRPGKNGGQLIDGPGPGRPRGCYSLRNEMRRQLAQGRTLETIVGVVIKAAKAGNIAAIRELIRQVDQDGADKVVVAGSLDINVNHRFDVGRLSTKELKDLKRLMDKMKVEDDATPGP